MTCTKAALLLQGPDLTGTGHPDHHHRPQHHALPPTLPTFLTRLGLPTPTHAHLEPTDADMGARRHQCGVCGRGFRLANDLRRHVRTHTGEKPYLCPHCPYRASQKQSVNRHVRTVHADLFLLKDPPPLRPATSISIPASLSSSLAAALSTAQSRVTSHTQARIDKV